MPVVNTASPKVRPRAPQARPGNLRPSSSTSTARSRPVSVVVTGHLQGGGNGRMQGDERGQRLLELGAAGPVEAALPQFSQPLSEEPSLRFLKAAARTGV